MLCKPLTWTKRLRSPDRRSTRTPGTPWHSVRRRPSGLPELHQSQPATAAATTQAWTQIQPSARSAYVST
jgi:hypothetical protein